MNSTLFKRPSTLCLPLAVQPDPAYYAQLRKMKRLATGTSAIIPGPQTAHIAMAHHLQPIHHHPSDGISMSMPDIEDMHEIPLEAAYNQPEIYMIPMKPNKTFSSHPEPQMHLQKQEHTLKNQSVMTLPIDDDDLIAPPLLPPPTTKQEDLFPNLAKAVTNLDNGASGATSTTKSRLDAILQRYDRLFRNATGGAAKLEKRDLDVTHVKPRTPPSLKNLKDHETTTITKSQLPDMIKTADTLQVEEMTSDMLDELLTELTEQGFNNAAADQAGLMKAADAVSTTETQTTIPEKPKAGQTENKVEKVEKRSPETLRERLKQHELNVPKPPEDTRTVSKGNPNVSCELPEKDVPKSFTYNEIKESMSKAKMEYSESETSHSHKTTNVSKKSSDATTTINSTSKAKIIPRILVDDAMELHRTKSYVVNLIDTALSNHFGTTVGHSYSKKKSHKKKMDARSAVEMLKKHSSSITSHREPSKCFVEELAQVITETLATASRHSSVSKDSECSCCGGDCAHIPGIVHRLRQMRWGHMKQIQQEVCRLEELDRFLDSCNTNTFDNHYH